MNAQHSYNEIYLLMCDSIKETTEGILERSLTPQELAHIYNAGSLMMLESVERSIEASSKETLSQMLLSESFLNRLEHAKRDLPKTLEEEFLGQTLSSQVIAKLQRLPYVYTAFQIMLKMEQTPQEARYQTLSDAVDDLI